MPSHDLLLHFQSDVTLLKSWWHNGKHYSRTLEAWLQLQDQHAKQGLAELERDAAAKGVEREEARKTFYRWVKFSLFRSVIRISLTALSQVQALLSRMLRVLWYEWW